MTITKYAVVNNTTRIEFIERADADKYALQNGGEVIEIQEEIKEPIAEEELIDDFISNTSGIVDDTATFGGYTIGQIVAALKRIGALA